MTVPIVWPLFHSNLIIIYVQMFIVFGLNDTAWFNIFCIHSYSVVFFSFLLSNQKENGIEVKLFSIAKFHMIFELNHAHDMNIFMKFFFSNMVFMHGNTDMKPTFTHRSQLSMDLSQNVNVRFNVFQTFC